MLSQPKNRVQAIKSKFESLQSETDVVILKKNVSHLNKYADYKKNTSTKESLEHNSNKENKDGQILPEDINFENNPEFLNKDLSIQPNSSYLYSSNDLKINLYDTKVSLTRQSSDPGKKLHRSHAFRCDRSQIINQGPKRHGSCNGRSETSDFTLKRNEKKLSKDRLKRLGNFIEDQMKKEQFIASNSLGAEDTSTTDSIPDSEVPKHILDQYAKVDKNKKVDKQDSLTDSGVSSETDVDEEKNGKIKRLVSQYEKPEQTSDESNLASMDELGGSNETMRLERKNPHLILTDTLKKALKQPLPPGPPPKKPPRVFTIVPQEPEKQKKDTKKMLEKLEQVLQKREGKTLNQSKDMYDIAEDNVTDKPKEVHYLCTEILGITNRTVSNQGRDPFSKCLNSLNCAIMTNNSTLSLPYTRLNDKMPCSCSNQNLSKRLGTFQNDSNSEANEKCDMCRSNEDKGFKCHLNCECKMFNSEFYLKKEHIYDVPFVDHEKSEYGVLNNWKETISRSMEDLRDQNSADQKIYDEPCDISRPATPEAADVKTDFQKLRENFETTPEAKGMCEKPKISKKPIHKIWKSTENVSDEFRFIRKSVEKKFATDTKKYRRFERCDKVGFSLPKNDCSQLDVDRENLNRLMTEIYETVTAACNMDDNKPGSFPTDASDSTSEESVKLTRSLTEKRKNYVRRVSSRVAYLDQRNVKTRYRHQTSVCSYKSEVVDNPYSTFRSWKSFRTSQNNLNLARDMSIESRADSTDGKELSMAESVGNLSIDEKTGCVDIGLPFEPRERGLFNVCMLVGLNYMTGQAYVKSVFPNQVQVPPHIENLIFPETLSPGSLGEWSADRNAQCYSLVLTDERGERAYGYCRRVLPEGATTCLPLCYCLIGKYRAPGFYYKILQEIESHHGNPEIEINQILQQLFETDFPNPGEQITITYNKTENVEKSNCHSTNLADVYKSKTMPRRNEVSVNVSVKKELEVENEGPAETEGFIQREREIVLDKESLEKHELPDYYDLENNNGPKRVTISLERPRTRVIKRPIEPRADEDNMSILLDNFGAGLVIKVFGSLLLERKVVVMGDQLGIVSSCMEAVQSALYPFVWQQPLISTIPSEIQRDVLEAPVPILAGMLKTGECDFSVQFEEGMLIDLTNPGKVLFYQGDESTILPTTSYKTLKTSLQMESNKQKDRRDTKTRNVMISEAFLRFFVEILGDFWKFFVEREPRDGEMGRDGVVFDKDAFIKQTSSKQNQYFLEWFTETAMFNHFIQNMAVFQHSSSDKNLIDTPLTDYYELFNERVQSRSKTNAKISEKNYKSAVNKKVKLLKTKLRDLVA